MVDVQQFIETRDRGPFELYDTYFVGPGANKRDSGWNDNFQDMALQEKLTFFAGRRSPQLAWTNQPGDRRDWAFVAEFITAEMVILLPSLGQFLSNTMDAQIMPAIWSQFAQSLGVTIKLGDAADTIWESPLSHVPAGNQAMGLNYADAAAPATIPANNGLAYKKAFLAFPKEGIELAAKSKIEVELRIADPIKSFFANANLPPPGYVDVPVGNTTVSLAQWYGIRIALHGTRAVQLRGARSSA